MAIIVEDRSSDSPLTSIHKPYFAIQITLRVLAFAATLAAAWLMFTSKETTVVGIHKAVARYTYSPSFKFFALANAIAFAFSILSLFVAWFLGRKAVHHSFHFYLFLHDLMMGLLLISACSAATAIGYLGKYGNSKIGWMGICNKFARFCNRSSSAILISYLGVACYLVLTVMSAKKSTSILD